jgi:hypothetical protein
MCGSACDLMLIPWLLGAFLLVDTQWCACVHNACAAHYVQQHVSAICRHP